MLQIYNSLTREKKPFTPIHPHQINMYVCGMTVYDFCHLGHARMLVAFDVIVRYLRASNFQVKYVRNITDIDDKILNRAKELNEPWIELSQRFIDAMHEDEKALFILPPDVEPRATDNIDKMITMIEILMTKGFAYQASNGDVYYDVARFENYGKLSNKDIEGQQAGARVEIVEEKHHPLDFVLWKRAKPDEPSWDSPWGAGRPGWHIECSAMSTDCLGDHFDIHGGGYDLQFPHHENEIAQSEAATGKTFVDVWMHVGYLQINREKMSKSLGNFFTVRDVLKHYPAEVIRYFLLSSHYRSQLNYSTENLESARGALERFYLSLRDLPVTEALSKTDYEEKFHAAMLDDFNTPEALAVLFNIAHEINQLRESDLDRAAQLGALLKQLAGIFGILQQDPQAFLQAGLNENEVTKIEKLIALRTKAREQKLWEEADKIRDQLRAMRVEIEDGSHGTTWRRVG